MEADQLKLLGNECFNDHKYGKAAWYYSQAIEAGGEQAVFYANRSLCHIKLESYGEAISDASRCIELDPSYLKAYFRRAEAFLALARFREALEDFKRVMNTSRAARARYEECRKALKEHEFAKAIESSVVVMCMSNHCFRDQTKLPSDRINFESLAVPTTYTGPTWADDQPISLEFVRKAVLWMKDQKTLPLKYAYRILKEVIPILRSLASLVRVDIPTGTHFTVCGDVHGQFYDLLNIFEMNGEPGPLNPYLFNGDFVDRGSFSTEVIFTLFMWKILFPDSMHLTRGNHETLTMNSMYGFQGEVREKYNDPCFELFTEAFNWLPLCYILGSKVMVVHGGLFSRDGVKLAEIEAIKRDDQPPDSGSDSVFPSHFFRSHVRASLE
jgi:serine/threonine-protein phosphatase 5